MAITFNYTVGAVLKVVTVRGYHINPDEENAIADVEWTDDWGVTHLERVEISVADVAVEFPLDVATKAKIAAASEAGLDDFFA
jgi:hypothetical protein